MAYITLEEYEAIFGESAVSAADFPIMAELASDAVDIVTYYNITAAGGISALPDFQRAAVKKATATQILYLAQNGGAAGTYGAETGKGFSVGRVRVDGNTANVNAAARGRSVSVVAPMALSILEQSGLMSPAVKVC